MPPDKSSDFQSNAGFSERTKTPSWRYWWILRNLMLNRKNISELSAHKSVDEMIDFIKTEYNQDSEYAISERLINEYGLLLTERNQCEEAVKFFKLNLELYPEGYYTHRTLDNYGQCLKELGYVKKALKSYEKSLQLNPKNSKTHASLVQLKKG